MQRILRDSGLRVSPNRILKSFKRVKAVPQERQRQNINDKVNPIIIANQGAFCILTKHFFLIEYDCPTD